MRADDPYPSVHASDVHVVVQYKNVSESHVLEYEAMHGHSTSTSLWAGDLDLLWLRLTETRSL